MASHTNEYQPDYVSPPGTSIQDILDERGMSQSSLACKAGLSEKHVSNIITGKVGLTADVAVALERVLGVPARFWLTREAGYREYLALKEEQHRLERDLVWIDNFPLKEMQKFGYIRREDDKFSRLISLLRFFGIASPSEFSAWWHRLQPSFRISSRKQPSIYALAAWLRKGELDAAQVSCSRFSKEGFRGSHEEIRSFTLDLPEVFQPKLIALCAQNGVAVVFVPELPRSYVSGATRWLNEGKALIQLSLRYKTADMLWFAFFHEAYHVLRQQKRALYMRDDASGDDTEDERRANIFAANLLIPPNEYRAFAHRHSTEQEIIAFSERIGIDPSVVIGRLQHDRYLPFNSNLSKLKTRFEWSKE
jgi:addiction module HigA family antidote